MVTGRGCSLGRRVVYRAVGFGRYAASSSEAKGLPVLILEGDAARADPGAVAGGLQVRAGVVVLGGFLMVVQVVVHGELLLVEHVDVVELGEYAQLDVRGLLDVLP